MHHGKCDEMFYFNVSPIAKPIRFQHLNSNNSSETGIGATLDDEWELSTDNEATAIFDEPIFDLNYRQKHVLEWMITRESQIPYGGIIASNMGDVDYKIKIITGLVYKSRIPKMVSTQSEGDLGSDLDEFSLFKGRTLIICPSKIIDKWIKCITENIPPGTLNVYIHHGKYRETTIFGLSQKDIVITTTTLLNLGFRQKDSNPLYQIKWHRIILDNALCARNYKLQTSKAVCQLSGICHWALVGSNVMDDDVDTIYSLIKYINYKSLNNLKKWKKWLEKNPTIPVKEKLKHIYYSKRII